MKISIKPFVKKKEEMVTKNGLCNTKISNFQNFLIRINNTDSWNLQV